MRKGFKSNHSGYEMSSCKASAFWNHVHVVRDVVELVVALRILHIGLVASFARLLQDVTHPLASQGLPERANS